MNKVIIMGRLTADPVLRTTTTGKQNCSFTVAVDRRGRDNGADFINCVAWEQSANFISNWFSKGKMIAIVGRLQTRSYDAKDGTKRFVTEVVVEEANFCGDKGRDGAPVNQSAGYAPQAQQGSQFQTASASDFEEIEDDEDLPF